MVALLRRTKDIGIYLRLSNTLLLELRYLQQRLHTSLLVFVEVCGTLLSDLTNSNLVVSNTSFGPIRLLKLVLVLVG